MKHLIRILTFGLILSSLGCSNQWREVDVDFEDTELNDMFSAALTESGDADRDAVLAMKDDSATAVYFAAGPGELGPVVSIASLYSFAFLGPEEANMGYWDIAEVSVAILDRPTTSGREAGFIFRYKLYGSDVYKTRIFYGSAELSDKKYRAVFRSGNQLVLAVESFDVSGGDLNAVIKLKAYDYDAQGNEMDNGQFSTLIGFGG